MAEPIWDAVNAALATARADVAAAAPDAATAAEGEAYVARVLTSCLADAVLGHLLTEDGFSRALPTRGAPNPDYRMLHAPVDRARHYRIEGRLNDSERVGIGLYRFTAGGAAEVTAYAAIDATSAAADGRFALDIADDAEGPGTLAIGADARVILVRTLHRGGTPARLTLSGGPPVGDLALAGGTSAAALTRAAGGMLGSIRQFLEWSALTSASPNRFVTDTAGLSQTVQGDPGSAYFLGYYDLAEGEWLEVTVPPGLPGYWSLHAYNHWCEPLPAAGAHDRSVADPRGGAVLAIGPAVPPDLPNRIDTCGRLRGVLIFRALGEIGATPPATRLRRGGP